MARKPRFLWNATAKRYVDTSTGRFVGNAQIRNALDTAISKAKTEIASLGEDLRSGRITLEDWQVAMREQIKAQHLSSAALARGGFAQMTQADYGRVGGTVASHYRYLNNFVADIKQGAPFDGTFTNRVRLYAEASRSTYEAAAREVADDGGATEERNILGVADHCDECISLTDDGWVPIGTMPPPGRRQCGVNCRCRMTYR